MFGRDILVDLAFIIDIPINFRTWGAPCKTKEMMQHCLIYLHLISLAGFRCFIDRDGEVIADRCATPTTWIILQQDGPNHLGLWYNALPEHQMALITSGCVPVSRNIAMNYLQTWLLIDVGGCLPITYIQSAHLSSHSLCHCFVSANAFVTACPRPFTVVAQTGTVRRMLMGDTPASSEAGAHEQGGQGTKGLKAVRLLRLGKMLRLRRLKTVWQRPKPKPPTCTF